MKKLMIAAGAALCAAVGFTEGEAPAVQSATIVGYSNIPLISGSKLAGAIFKGITTEGMKLTELTPAGYLENPVWTEMYSGAAGCQGGFTIQLLSFDGSLAKDEDENPMEFKWFHFCDTWGDEPVWDAAGHWARKLKDSKDWTEITSANDVTFPEGLALWVTAQDFNEGMIIQHAGEALTTSKDVALISGANAVVIPLSADVKLTQLTPIGYLENPVWTEMYSGAAGCQGGFAIQLLSFDGSLATDEDGNPMEFKWFHFCDTWGDEPIWDPAGHWARKLKDSKDWTEITSANDVTFKASDGLWVTTQDWNKGMAIRTPALAK